MLPPPPPEKQGSAFIFLALPQHLWAKVCRTAWSLHIGPRFVSDGAGVLARRQLDEIQHDRRSAGAASRCVRDCSTPRPRPTCSHGTTAGSQSMPACESLSTTATFRAPPKASSTSCDTAPGPRSPSNGSRLSVAATADLRKSAPHSRGTSVASGSACGFGAAATAGHLLSPLLVCYVELTETALS
jgi:hypothetical protein